MSIDRCANVCVFERLSKVKVRECVNGFNGRAGSGKEKREADEKPSKTAFIYSNVFMKFSYFTYMHIYEYIYNMNY